jgi:hypothetical protein
MLVLDEGNLALAAGFGAGMVAGEVAVGFGQGFRYGLQRLAPCRAQANPFYPAHLG